MHSIFKKIGLENFVAIDVETTGLDCKEDKIIEISACRFVNGKQKETFSQLINPNKKIPYFIENLTGITNDKIKEQPLFKDVSAKFIDFISDVFSIKIIFISAFFAIFFDLLIQINSMVFFAFLIPAVS